MAHEHGQICPSAGMLSTAQAVEEQLRAERARSEACPTSTIAFVTFETEHDRLAAFKAFNSSESPGWGAS